METIDWSTLGAFGIYAVAAMLCLLGFVLSCLSLSGTWLVFGASLLVVWKHGIDFVGIMMLVVFLLLCVGVEIAETLAGSWGVKRRGGSRAAGLAALCGGFIGMLCGGFLIPVPVIGNLAGMLAGSFGAAFLVEHAKIKKANHAAHVATGAVLARLAVIFLKIGVTLLMVIVLAIGLIRS